MRFSVVGADKETGDDVEVTLEAATQTAAEELATRRGILVSAVKEIPKEVGAIALVEDAPAPSTEPHGGNGDAHAPAAQAHGPTAAPAAHGDPHAPAPHAHAHGHITVSASNPSDTAHTSEGTAPLVQRAEAAMEYHILLNQSLYLLESAVNKHIHDGWEPQGGVAVGVSNNALSYFQAVIRKKQKPAG